MKEFPASPTSPSMSQRTYEVTIHSQVPHSPGQQQRQLSSPRNTYYGDSSPTNAHHERFQSIQEAAFPDANTNVVVERPQIRTLDANKATLSYCKTALLFFLALLCTWYVLFLSWFEMCADSLSQGSFYDKPSVYSSTTESLCLRAGLCLWPGASSSGILEYCHLHRHQPTCVQGLVGGCSRHLHFSSASARPNHVSAQFLFETQPPRSRL